VTAYCVSDMLGALLWCEAIEQGADALPGCFDSSLDGLSEQRFQLGERLLDRIEVRTVGRRKRSLAPTDRMGAPHGLVAAEIVHDDNVAGLSVGTRNCSIRL
jgi:hypothetical protein